MLLVTPPDARGLARRHRVADAVLLHRPVRHGRRARGDGRDRRGRARASRSVTGGDRTAELLGHRLGVGDRLGLVDNIPFTAAMIPVVEQLQRRRRRRRLLVGARARRLLRRQRHDRRRRRQRRRRRDGRARRPADRLPRRSSGSAIPVTLVSMVLATAYIAAEVRYEPAHRSPIRCCARRRCIARATSVERRRARRARQRPPGPARRRRRRALRRASSASASSSARCSPATSSSSSTPASSRSRSTTRSRSAASCRAEPVGKYMNTEHIDVGTRLLRRPGRRDLPPPPRPDRPGRRAATRRRRHHPRRLLPRARASGSSAIADDGPRAARRRRSRRP